MYFTSILVSTGSASEWLDFTFVLFFFFWFASFLQPTLGSVSTVFLPLTFLNLITVTSPKWVQSFIFGIAIYAYLSLCSWCDLWILSYRCVVPNLSKLLFPARSWARVSTAISLLSTHSAWLTYLSPCLEAIFSLKTVSETPGHSHSIRSTDLQLACFLQHVVWQRLNTHQMQQPFSYQLSVLDFNDNLSTFSICKFLCPSPTSKTCIKHP